MRRRVRDLEARLDWWKAEDGAFFTISRTIHLDTQCMYTEYIQGYKWVFAYCLHSCGAVIMVNGKYWAK